MATLIKTDGSEAEIQPANGKSFTLEEMQKCVGGNIELAHTRDGRMMWINEEGKLNDLPPNEKATQLYVHNDHDIIVGDVLVGTEKEFADDDEE